MKRGKVKVAWDDVCLPKYEGGLGVRKLESFSTALMSTHIWKIITHKESMWVKWIHAYKLKHRSFWDVPLTANVSWGWRKLLQIRNKVRPHVWYQLGNGGKASMWYDTWDELCPLMNHVTHRAVSNAGYNKREKVVNVVNDGSWSWPQTWYNHFPPLSQINFPNLRPDQPDSLVWKYNGRFFEFSVKACLACYAKRLLTQDRMRQWHVGNDTDLASLRCPLCKTQPDSHEHLFFNVLFQLKCGSPWWKRLEKAAYPR
ncbi:reverse transcriptase zinc-binding domain-containing protein [Artemisia annua]|uniref:Reverse transcriptase zinc-binding domain-containing protein n=1 Tax=Artemisia annua TaxID=35608 RepID=A0A2U1KI47_ARTAN|nr:reverse transcriptase zinc-binding domain-containing protein [Artemisia annua]